VRSLQRDEGGAVTVAIKKVRREAYRAGRVLGDLDAVASGKPDRIVKRIINKWLGRKLLWRFWRR